MKPQEFYNSLEQNGIKCFCGVPDSLLKDFCAYVTDNADNHTITANEGNAVALAAGHYLATGNIACVYMQNSGIGNCVNPLLSLTDEEVYNIPVLILIGWRGEPTKHDEPQHIKQGKVTDKLLECMGIEYAVLDEDFAKAQPQIQKAFLYMKETNRPYAFIIRKGLFEKYTLQNKKQTPYTLVREEAIETVIKNLKSNDIVVSTTGHISREVYETRIRLGQSHKQDFLTVGSMGHSSSIALGIALQKPNRNIFCLDGDGALLMHTGSLIINASKHLENFKHIVFNNEVHDSVGAQPTAIGTSDLKKLVLDAGYKKAYSVSSKEELEKTLPEFINDKCTSFLEIKVKSGARADLGRPKESPIENKEIFMSNLRQVEFVGQDSIKNLSGILKEQNCKNVLVFSGKKSYQNIKNTIENELKNCNIQYYSDFSTNPKKEEIDIAINNITPNFDIIIAVGGGSVIDFAKAYRYYTKSAKSLIAIPTTAGTGSESTQFSVIYINGEKKSLDDKSILPEFAITDCQFLKSSPKYLKASCAMDAYCQAIESYWAVQSTPESRKYAIESIKLCKDNIIEYVNSDNTPSNQNIMLASHLAGKAINISRTTAAHALSYKITTDYNIPHGHAVCLSMADLFIANSKIDNTCCNDKRGADFVKERICEILSILNLKSSDEFRIYWENLLNKLGLDNPIKALTQNQKQELISKVNIERLSNNPKKLDKDLNAFWN